MNTTFEMKSVQIAQPKPVRAALKSLEIGAFLIRLFTQISFYRDDPAAVRYAENKYASGRD